MVINFLILPAILRKTLEAISKLSGYKWRFDLKSNLHLDKIFPLLAGFSFITPSNYIPERKFIGIAFEFLKMIHCKTE